MNFNFQAVDGERLQNFDATFGFQSYLRGDAF